jgi:hypothetical protein
MDAEKLISIAIISILLIISIGTWAFVTSDGDSDWDKQCVHGQLVYTKTFVYKGFAVNAMDDGKEIKCNSEDY